MKILDIQPSIGGVSSAPAAEYTRSVSDKAISEQFCLVAKDIRSSLQAMRESIEIQKQIFNSIENVSLKLDENNSKIEALQASVSDLNEQNCSHVDQLTKNTMIIAHSINDEQSLNAVLEKVTQAPTV